MPIALPAVPSAPTMNMQGYAASLEQGAHIFLLVGGVSVGYITSISQNDDEGTQAFYGVGTNMPLEIQPMRWSGSLTVSGARVYNASWQQAFMLPGSFVLTQGLVNIAVQNRVTGQPDVIFQGCVPSTYGNTWSANAFTLQNGTWLYRNVVVSGYGM